MGSTVFSLLRLPAVVNGIWTTCTTFCSKYLVWHMYFLGLVWWGPFIHLHGGCCSYEANITLSKAGDSWSSLPCCAMDHRTLFLALLRVPPWQPSFCAVFCFFCFASGSPLLLSFLCSLDVYLEKGAFHFEVKATKQRSPTQTSPTDSGPSF